MFFNEYGSTVTIIFSTRTVDPAIHLNIYLFTDLTITNSITPYMLQGVLTVMDTPSRYGLSIGLGGI